MRVGAKARANCVRLLHVSALLGHLYTLGPFLQYGLRPPQAPASTPFELAVPDAQYGAVPLRGRLSSAGRRSCIVAVHGLGGDAESAYVVAFAKAAWERGHDVLRLGMRGSDGLGDDVYHAGLASDLAAVCASPALASYAELRLVGFSLGGHLALHAAMSNADARLRAVAAVGSPLDLALGQVAIDATKRWPYRRHVLRGLCAMAVRLAERGRLPSPLAAVKRARTLRDWDRLVVAKRFGFDGPEAYYASESVGPRLSKLAVPTIYVGAEYDPMIPASTVQPALARASSALEVRWLRRAGHIGFASEADLGERGERRFEPQLLSWLERAG